MTGLLIATFLGLLSLIFVKLVARLPVRDLSMPAAVLLLGLAGYAWQGRPGLIGHPVQAKAAVQFDERLAEKRRSIGERLGPASQWLIMSDGLARQGNTKDAANVLMAGLRRDPKDADLWVGLGNALLAHAGGVLSPASTYAYQQAIKLQPDSVSASYFYGLALAQSGQLEQGKAVWLSLIPKLPEKADMRFELARNMMLIDQLIAQRDAARSPSGRQAP